jgi:hypothetical protein
MDPREFDDTPLQEAKYQERELEGEQFVIHYIIGLAKIIY